MMLSFKNYMTDRGRYLQLGEMARDLSCHTRDPEGFLLRFTEARFPHLYVPLIESFYMEVTPDAPPPAPADAAGGADADGPGARPADAVANGGGKSGAMSGGIVSWLSNLFGGGGAKKNFEKSLASLIKVNGVLQTVRVPPEAQGEGQPAAGYDKFRDELKELLDKLSGMKDQVGNLNVADAIKKDPSYIQELEQDKNLAPLRADAELAPPPAPEDGAAPAGTPAGAAPKNDNDPVADAPVQRAHAAADKGDFSGFGAAADEVKEEWEKMTRSGYDQKKKHERLAYLMRYHNHKEKDMQEARRRRRVLNESFSEAMVLAGVPARRKA